MNPAEVHADDTFPFGRYVEPRAFVLSIVETGIDQASRAREQPIVEHQEAPRRHCLPGPLVLLTRKGWVVDGSEVDDLDVGMTSMRCLPRVPKQLLHPAERIRPRCHQNAALVDGQAPEDRLVRREPEAGLPTFVEPCCLDRSRFKTLGISRMTKQHARRLIRHMSPETLAAK